MIVDSNGLMFPAILFAGLVGTPLAIMALMAQAAFALIWPELMAPLATMMERAALFAYFYVAVCYAIFSN